MGTQTQSHNPPDSMLINLMRDGKIKVKLMMINNNDK